MPTINVRRLDDGVVRRIKRRAAEDDMAAKRAAFRETMDRLRPLTEGRKQTPAEVLIREDRDRGHRDDF